MKVHRPDWHIPASARSLAAKAYLKAIARTSQPIVLGPFRSELGFEALYWVPFLNWALTYAGISPDRCLAVSRGGMGAFYPAKTHVDLYTLRGVDAVRLENQVDYETRRLQKQTQITPWDLQVAQEAVERVHGKGQRFHLLHPSWMYWLFEPFWEERSTMRLIAAHCDFGLPPTPELPDGFNLPEKFVAVRFYERHTLPFDGEVPDILREMVYGLAEKYPVVLLNQQLFADDHVDLPIVGPNILALPAIPPEQNFILQGAVLARCAAFVGTYGGVAQWALRYRRPSLSVYAHFNGTALAHRNLSALLSARTNTPFELLDLRMLKLWRGAMQQIEAVAA